MAVGGITLAAASAAFTYIVMRGAYAPTAARPKVAPHTGICQVCQSTLAHFRHGNADAAAVVSLTTTQVLTSAGRTSWAVATPANGM